MQKKNLVWLASYPKSGNTWLRIFLTALYTGKSHVDINQLTISHNYADQTFFNYATELNGSELPQSEIDALRPKVFNYLSDLNEDLTYIKIHERYMAPPDAHPLIPSKTSKLVIYIVRNPLDVAVSYAHHSGKSIDATIDFMNTPSILNNIKGNRGMDIFSERLGSWSEHVSSWLDNQNIPVHILKYEEMYEHSLHSFIKLVTNLGLSFDERQIQHAINASSFNNLRKQEENNTFVEMNIQSKYFFRVGKPGSWKTELNQSQRERIIEHHQVMMTKLGYLDLKQQHQ